MGLVTVFCPPMTTGAVALVFQTAGETRLVANSKVNPVALVGHVNITFVPERMMVNCGGMKRLNTVPSPEIPPPYAVPYRVLPNKIKPAYRLNPSLLVKRPKELV